MAYIYSVENNEFNEVKSITPECYEQLEKDNRIVKECHAQYMVFQYLQLTLKEYHDFVESISNIVNSKVNVEAIQSESFSIKVNHIILNVLTSFKFFLDNAHTFLSRKYGNKSVQLESFKKFTNNLYDSSFSYRLLSRLRNYALHLGFPINSIVYKVHTHQGLHNSIGDILMEIDIDKLKYEKSLLGSLYSEIALIDNNIDIREHVNNLSQAIMKLQIHIYSLQKIDLEEAMSNIICYLGKYKTSQNKLAIIDNINVTEEKITFSQNLVPFESISELKNFKNNWCQQ
jgi:hypothetical protein